MRFFVKKFFGKYGQYVLFFSLFALLFILLFDSGYSSSVNEGISLFISNVLPFVFPYFFITALLTGLSVTKKIFSRFDPISKRLFNCGGQVGYAFIISVVSGYPTGAKAVSELKNNRLLTETESRRASCFCACCSPVFMLKSVGVIMFGNGLFGLLLFLTNLVSAVLTGIVFSFYKKNEVPSASPLTEKSSSFGGLYESAYSSVMSLLIVGSLITFFYVLTEVLFNLKIIGVTSRLFNAILKEENLSYGISFGLFECTRGIKVISLSKISLFTLPVVSALCGFGGLSVILQSVAFLKKAKIKTAPFILSRILCAVISFFIGLFFSFIYL